MNPSASHLGVKSYLKHLGLGKSGTRWWFLLRISPGLGGTWYEAGRFDLPAADLLKRGSLFGPATKATLLSLKKSLNCRVWSSEEAKKHSKSFLSLTSNHFFSIGDTSFHHCREKHMH